MESGPDNSISNEKELQDAVVQGDVALLRQLLQRDPFILHRPLAAMATSSFYPLHVACRLGHLSFVSELLRLHPELSEVVDPNDQSSTPLHIAARTGQLDVVKVLVTANPSACFARDSQGRNPVHVAVARNCLAVLDELTGASPAAARERVAVTAGGGGGRGDTIMHLCLNQGTFEALELLVDKLGNIAILNAGDGDGNTILHLAATNKQIQTIKFLLKDARINVKAQNSDGFTAMDVVSSWHKACDNHEASVNKEIKHLFRRARVSRYLYAGQYNSTKKPEYIGKWIENQKSNLIVVASLIATMAFQAGINPPGGVWQSDENPQNSTSLNPPMQHAGTSVLAYKHSTNYHLFLALNTTGFMSSMGSILLMISGLPCKRFMNFVIMVTMWIAVTVMAAVYREALDILTPSESLSKKGHDKTSMKIIRYSEYAWMAITGVLFLGHFIRVFVKMAKLLFCPIRKLWTSLRENVVKQTLT